MKPGFLLFSREYRPLAVCWLACGLLAGLAAGCGQNDVQEYRVAKEPPAPDAETQQAPAAAPAGAPDATSSPPVVQWKRPASWEEVAPGEMRLASFRVADKNGKQAEVSIVPLQGMAGTDLANVNRWRGQVGLPDVSEEELPKLAETVEIGGQSGQLYEAAGTPSGGSGEKARILAAVLRREGTAWFFKMIGDDALVAQQKPVFVEFLKTVNFKGTMPESAISIPPALAGLGSAPSTASATGSGSAKPDWQVPAGWREVPGGQFLVAKFALTGAGDAQAAVNVSMSAGDGGGLMANVNRWRGQLGLGPVAESDLQQQTQALEVPGGKATVVEMSGTDARTGQKAQLIGAVVPQGGQTWFFKMMGNADIVEREKGAFTKFVQSAKYPNGV